MPTSCPLVSVILPCCNSQRWIEQAVSSVLQQSHSNLELIIVDDASTDATPNTLKNFKDSRVTVVAREQRSGGPATPRNQGIREAKGEYLAFIDSDDIWHAEKLERQLLSISQNDLNFISTQHICFRHNKPDTPKLGDLNKRINRKNHSKLLRKNWVITSSALVHRELFEGVNFNQADQYIGVEDYLAWLYIHQNQRISSAILEAPLVYYRLRDDSLSHSKLRMAKKIFYLLNNYENYGKPLGLSAYYYFASYIYASLATRLSGKR